MAERRPDTAVILAAGSGLRLNEIGKVCPKGFLQLANRPIVEESVIRLGIAGINHVVIVTGYLSEHYVELAARYVNTITLVHNSQFLESGSMHSLFLAERQLKSDFLLLDSDIIYEQRALTEVLIDPCANVMLVSAITGSGDEVYVEMRGGLLRGLSKRGRDLGNDVLGEMVGISKISRSLLEEMIRVTERQKCQPIRLEYQDALMEAARKVPVGCRLINDLAWTEIDTSNDLSRAAERIYPIIIARDGRSQ